MARTKTTAQSNADWLASVQTFRDQLEIYKADMNDIKNDFQQIAADVSALRDRAENCGKGIYIYGSWNLFSRALALQNLISDTAKFDRVRDIMRQGLGIPNNEYNGQYDSDFASNVSAGDVSAGDVSSPDPNRAASAPKIYPTE